MMSEMFENRKALSTKRFLQHDLKEDLFAEFSIFRLIHNVDTDEAMSNLIHTANWFEHPHPQGRDQRGESDFASIRLIPALFECYEKLTDEAKAALKRFFLENDYSSIYGSENHAIMYRVSRYLAACFFQNEYFSQYKLTAKEVIEKDTKYIHEFIDFRAKYGWGEFDSFGYSAEILFILNTLYHYTKDKTLKQKSRMMLDVILLDMILDSKDGLYGGAHGRIYEYSSLNTKYSGMFHYYCFYFGGPFSEGIAAHDTMNLLSEYIPSPIVYEIEKNRVFPYENRERKHLHSITSWCGEILYDTLSKIKGSINKYTYLCDEYILGSVNHQDDYPCDLPNDASYAHHQQHEWELTLLSGTNHKIFSHHPGDPGYHHIHNHWTGDYGCCCGTYYTNQNTALALYNIVKENEYKYINAYIPLSIFDETILEKQYLFFKYRNLYIFVYFHNGYRIVKDGEFADCELISDGSQNAVICHVEYTKDYSSLEQFASSMKDKPILFNKAALTLDFNGITLFYHGNKENGKENRYPYQKLYDSPYMQSIWESGIMELTCGDKKEIYDFNR